jgi:hypothetical protein
MLVRLRKLPLAFAVALAFAIAPIASAGAQGGVSAAAPPAAHPEFLTNGAAAVGCGLAVRYAPVLIGVGGTGGAIIIASVCVFALFEAAATH